MRNGRERRHMKDLKCLPSKPLKTSSILNGTKQTSSVLGPSHIVLCHPCRKYKEIHRQ